MNKIDFGDFTWFSPKPKAVQMAITIPNAETFNLNGKLMEQMPTCVEIGVKPDGRMLCLRERTSGGYKLPKSGCIKSKELIDCLMRANVRLPARYSVTKEDDCWIAVLDEYRPPKVDMTKKHTPRKVGSKTLQALRKEAESI